MLVCACMDFTMCTWKGQQLFNYIYIYIPLLQVLTRRQQLQMVKDIEAAKNEAKESKGRGAARGGGRGRGRGRGNPKTKAKAKTQPQEQQQEIDESETGMEVEVKNLPSSSSRKRGDQTPERRKLFTSCSPSKLMETQVDEAVVQSSPPVKRTPKGPGTQQRRKPRPKFRKKRNLRKQSNLRLLLRLCLQRPVLKLGKAVKGWKRRRLRRRRSPELLAKSRKLGHWLSFRMPRMMRKTLLHGNMPSKCLMPPSVKSAIAFLKWLIGHSQCTGGHAVWDFFKRFAGVGPNMCWALVVGIANISPFLQKPPACSFLDSIKLADSHMIFAIEYATAILHANDFGKSWLWGKACVMNTWDFSTYHAYS